MTDQIQYSEEDILIAARECGILWTARSAELSILEFWSLALSSQAEQIRKLDEQNINQRKEMIACLEVRKELESQLVQANETIAALQAEIKARSDDGADAETFERMKELRAQVAALLAVIEQKDEALDDLNKQVHKFCEEQGEWDFYTGDAEKALALTPDLAAIKEHDVQLLLSILQQEAKHVEGESVLDMVCRMIDDLRQPIEQDDPGRPVKPHRSGGGYWVGKP